MRLRRHRALASILTSLPLVIAVALVGVRGGSERPVDRRSGVATEVRARQSASAELVEQTETTDLRLEALERARVSGLVGRQGPFARTAAPGWAGETVMSATGDDWEPAIAADPTAPYVYVLHNRYGGTPACAKNCPDPAMILSVSADGGKTFAADRYLCACRRVHGQYDPEIEVVPGTGAVYAAWMNDFDIQFAKSLDHGKTWGAPVPVYGTVAWGDKPVLASSNDGRDVYVSFNGPTGGDPWVAVSHDAGDTWSQVRVTQSDRYYFGYGGAVLPDGSVVSSETSFTYTGPGGAAEGPTQMRVLRSSDGGATWTDTLVDTLQLGSACASDGCYADFYDSGPALAKDGSGGLVMVYNGASSPFGPQTVFARSSTDGGLTWSPRVGLSTPGVNAAFPAAAATANGDVRVWFMDQSTGRWNTWFTGSKDLGATWSAPVRISDATSGAAYKNGDGFLEAYGDYGEIAITNRGKTVATWGEGFSYAGPGGVWVNRER